MRAAGWTGAAAQHTAAAAASGDKHRPCSSSSARRRNADCRVCAPLVTPVRLNDPLCAGIKMFYGPDTYYGEEVSVLEMDGQFDKLEVSGRYRKGGTCLPGDGRRSSLPAPPVAAPTSCSSAGADPLPQFSSLAAPHPVCVLLKPSTH